MGGICGLNLAIVIFCSFICGRIGAGGVGGLYCTHLVAWHHPFALGHEPLCALLESGSGSKDIVLSTTGVSFPFHTLFPFSKKKLYIYIYSANFFPQNSKNPFCPGYHNCPITFAPHQTILLCSSVCVSLSLPLLEKKREKEVFKKKKKTHHREVLKRPRLVNVLERALEVLQLEVHLALGLLGVLHRLRLKRLDGAQLPRHVVRGRLERLEPLLNLADDGLVLQRGAVLGKVDFLRLLRQQLHAAARVVVALLERRQRCRRLASDAERRADAGPVDLERGASLFQNTPKKKNC